MRQLGEHLTLPNQLTILRLLLIPVIGVALTSSFAYHDQIGCALYAGAAATDSLDGLSSTLGGKSKTLTQNLMIGALILSRPYPAFRPVAAVVVGVALIATVSSGLDYLWRYRRFVL